MFQGVQCPVCCEVATDDDDSQCDFSVLLSCGHVYHTACLLQCLEHKNQCPTCRAPVQTNRRGQGGHMRVYIPFSSSALIAAGATPRTMKKRKRGDEGDEGEDLEGERRNDGGEVTAAQAAALEAQVSELARRLREAREDAADAGRARRAAEEAAAAEALQARDAAAAVEALAESRVSDARRLAEEAEASAAAAKRERDAALQRAHLAAQAKSRGEAAARAAREKLAAEAARARREADGWRLIADKDINKAEISRIVSRLIQGDDDGVHRRGSGGGSDDGGGGGRESVDALPSSTSTSETVAFLSAALEEQKRVSRQLRASLANAENAAVAARRSAAVAAAASRARGGEGIGASAATAEATTTTATQRSHLPSHQRPKTASSLSRNPPAKKQAAAGSEDDGIDEVLLDLIGEDDEGGVDDRENDRGSDGDLGGAAAPAKRSFLPPSSYLLPTQGVGGARLGGEPAAGTGAAGATTTTSTMPLPSSSFVAGASARPFGASSNSTSSGTFIRHGADGRGGRTAALRPRAGLELGGGGFGRATTAAPLGGLGGGSNGARSFAASLAAAANKRAAGKGGSGSDHSTSVEIRRFFAPRK